MAEVMALNNDKGEEMSRQDNLVMAAKMAYCALLESDFPGRNTAHGQRILCDLRDAIAEATGNDPKVVQENCEWFVLSTKAAK